MSDPSSPSGWFPDPLGRYEFRFFNGRTWTSDVSNDGQRYVDPLGTAANAPGVAGGPTGVPDPRSNKSATAAIVMGSIALVIAWMPYLVAAGLTLAVLAIVFGVRGRRRSRDGGTGRAASTAGIVLGVLGVGLSVIGIVLTVVVTKEVYRFVEPGPVVTEVTACDVDGRRADIAGTLTNADDGDRDYTLFVEIDGATEAIRIDDVAPGETVDWATVVTTRDPDARCDPELIVNGPFPFDVEVDPIR